MQCDDLFKNLALPINTQAKRNTPIIALEGHNGSGKSTIANMICNFFKVEQHLGVPEMFLTHGRKLRMITEASWQASSMYFLSGVAEKLRELHDLESEAGFHIIERSLWSTLSAHFSEDSERLPKLLSTVDMMGIEIFEPDFTIILNASFEHCKERILQKTNQEEIILDSLLMYESYYHKESEFYAWIGKQRRGKVFQLDVTNEESAAVFEKQVLPLLNSFKKQGE